MSEMDALKETLIVERRAHIDSLVAKLREPRVCKIIDPMLAGDPTGADVLDDDIAYGACPKQQGRSGGIILWRPTLPGP